MTTHYVWWIKGAEFSELAQLSIDSVRKVDEDAKCHVWTDEPDTTPKPQHAIYHIFSAGRPAMIANLDAQIAALNYLQRGDRVLFLDADTLMLKPFPWALYPKLWVTWRAEVNGQREPAILQPYNYGVIGTYVCPEVLEAFYWMRARIWQMSPKSQEWYGNQLALAELIGAAPKEGEADKDVHINWSLMDSGTVLTVRQLPCDVFNFSPNSTDEDVSGKAILHMKGGRKDLMQMFARRAA